MFQNLRWFTAVVATILLTIGSAASFKDHKDPFGFENLTHDHKIINALYTGTPVDFLLRSADSIREAQAYRYVKFDTFSVRENKTGKSYLVTLYADEFYGKVTVFKDNGSSFDSVWSTKVSFGAWPEVKTESLVAGEPVAIILSGVGGARAYESCEIFLWEKDKGRLISPPPGTGFENAFVGRDIEIQDIDGDGSKEVIVHQELKTSGPLYGPMEKIIYKYDRTQKRYVQIKRERPEIK